MKAHLKMKNCKNLAALLAILLGVAIPTSVVAQSSNPESRIQYLRLNGAVQSLGVADITQTGVAHKRGDYNEFSTDFDMNVHVEGQTTAALELGYGVSMGQEIFHLNDWHFVGEVELQWGHSKLSSSLVNPENEIVSHIVGDSGDQVIEFVNDHYGKGHHRFANIMQLNRLTAGLNVLAIKKISDKSEVLFGYGRLFSMTQMTAAVSMQTSPANDPPGHETTTDLEGGAVNHFNTRTYASCQINGHQFQLGWRHSIYSGLMLSLQYQLSLMGSSDYTFGSTHYLDHVPTDQWNYQMGSMAIQGLNLGLAFKL